MTTTITIEVEVVSDVTPGDPGDYNTPPTGDEVEITAVLLTQSSPHSKALPLKIDVFAYLDDDTIEQLEESILEDAYDNPPEPDDDFDMACDRAREDD